MTFAGLVYHADSSLCVKIFPAGLHNKIDWDTVVFSEGKFDFFSFKEKQAKENYIDYCQNTELNINPLRLKETVRYKCVVSYEGKKEDDASTRFNPHLRNESNKLLKIERDDDSSLTFQYINYLGKTELLFNDKDGEHSLCFEVVPDKINYEDDYVRLTEEIAEECSTLLLDYTSPTSLNFQQDPSKESNILEQFIFLRQFCFSDNLESLFASIKRNPDRILIREEELKPFGSGIPSGKFFSNPFSHSRGWMKTADDTYLPSEVATIHKYDSYDTSANRFIKFALITFSEVCSKVLEKVSIDKNGSEYFSEASKILNQIDDILNDSFFDDINELSIMPVNNQVLEKREGYNQIFNAFSMVDLALKLNWKGKEDVYSGEAKNTALLYEYWLVFKIIAILKNLGAEFDLDLEKDTDVNHMLSIKNGLLVSIKEGETSLISALLKDRNMKIKFYYNKTFSKKDFDGTDYQGSYSRPFRPDYTLSIFPSIYNEKQAIEAGEVSFIHFDAKYRVSDITSLFGKENQDTNDFDDEKKNETMNTYNRGDLLKMHTYNDAIRKTIGSYVLFPGVSQEGKKFNIYDELLPGVGAFAIRPGDKERTGEKQIEKFINDVIVFKSYASSRQYRKEFFDNIVIKSPSTPLQDEKEALLKYESNKPTYIMCGMIRNDYIKYLNEKHILPRNADDKDYKLINNTEELLFYYHAIKDSVVYALHANTSDAKYFCGSQTDFGKTAFIKLEDWTADIVKSELVSSEKLKERLYQNCEYRLENPKADFYYLVTLNNVKWHGNEIAGTVYKAYENIGNMAASPYSPKIIEVKK